MHEHLSFKFCWFGGLAALIGGALLGFGARAADLGDTHTLNLEEAIRMALESSPALEAAGARIEAAAGRAYQAKQWTNPQLQLNAEEWPVSRGRGFSDAIQTIGIVQTLPYPGKKSLDKRIGGIGVRVSEAEWALRRTEVVRDVKAEFRGSLRLRGSWRRPRNWWRLHNRRPRQRGSELKRGRHPTRSSCARRCSWSRCNQS